MVILAVVLLILINIITFLSTETILVNLYFTTFFSTFVVYPYRYSANSHLFANAKGAGNGKLLRIKMKRLDK